MSLYAIGDLHLHFQSELKAPGQIHGRVWKDHERKFQRYCAEMLTDADTLVLVGDHSWGKNLQQSLPDLQYISALPGRKILLRGNHDMFWEANKTPRLNELFAGKLQFLQNNYYSYQDAALVGTKGYTFEGPFYLDRRGRIIGWDEQTQKHAQKLVDREIRRLETSFEMARRDGFRRFIMFLHYPPTDILQEDSPFTRMAEQYGAEQVIYGHCHGENRFNDSIRGMHGGIRYSLVSGDCLRWIPEKLLD